MEAGFTPQHPQEAWYAPMPRKRKPSKITPLPETIETAKDRGQALKHWIETNNYSLEIMEIETGISQMQFSRYFRGENDIAKMKTENLEKLLTVMAITDWDGWDYFNIPEQHRKTNWTTRRPYPMGHGDAKAYETLVFNLEGTPLQGAVTVQDTRLFQVTVDRNKRGNLLVFRLPNMFFVTGKDTPISSDWELLGSFRSVALIEPEPLLHADKR